MTKTKALSQTVFM